LGIEFCIFLKEYWRTRIDVMINLEIIIKQGLLSFKRSFIFQRDKKRIFLCRVRYWMDFKTRGSRECWSV